ncbi:MAG: NAD(P)-dependent oxidoreductase [Sandaracinaceae bacterium]
MSRVAVLGLGAMGGRMARRLIDAGYEVTVYNRSASRAEPLVEAGARRAATPRAAVAEADVAIACVTDDEASRKVWLDDAEGALAALGPDAVAVESSTLTPAWVRSLGGHMAEARRAFLDAPVVGSRPQAEAGQLVHLLGGEPGHLDAARPVLEVVGGAVHHVGPVGAGTVVKLVVNALFGIQVAAVGELLALAERSGVAKARAAEVLAALPVTSPAASLVAGLIVKEVYAPLFPIDLVDKDFRYALAQAEAVGLDAPSLAGTRAVYARAREAGLGDLNIHAVAKLFDPPAGE